MSARIVDATTLPVGRGPHPAASPFEKRVGEAVGVTAFGLYQVELPAGEETVPHDHTDDHAEDAYAILRGTGWVVVDGEEIPVGPGRFVAVTEGSTRFLRAGHETLVFIAVCA
ncbi:cupin domain-containing protein [Actinomycetospora soli]|uniref:cupin domain-containing protein n=1 Tax=Actinomycetospora soli TaxID=2893887 RepID=UPI001E4A09EE|nr:cupin domain-containing protein [Actinomycetospora soli]MCD2189374.1 cupin domain-containing protein [Actinomycetospora soli]